MANIALGAMTAAGIRLWIDTTGRRVAHALWLDSPFGPSTGVIGPAFRGEPAAREQLEMRPDPAAEPLPDFDVLASPNFDPGAVRPETRDLCEHTSRASPRPGLDW